MTESLGTQNDGLPMPTFVDVCTEWHKAAEKAHSFNRLITTDAKIAQTPKELVWVLNKAKLYHYIPVVPKEKRKRIPLLMVFAIIGPKCRIERANQGAQTPAEHAEFV